MEIKKDNAMCILLFRVKNDHNPAVLNLITLRSPVIFEGLLMNYRHRWFLRGCRWIIATTGYFVKIVVWTNGFDGKLTLAVNTLYQWSFVCVLKLTIFWSSWFIGREIGLRGRLTFSYLTWRNMHAPLHTKKPTNCSRRTKCKWALFFRQ